jgi:hypothetical protein
MYPHRLVPRRKERANYDLCAAIGTTIRTYGWQPLCLNLGLRQDFMWQFIMADVTHPIIGVDFLSHFGLLVDCRNNRLLDGITSQSPVWYVDVHNDNHVHCNKYLLSSV